MAPFLLGGRRGWGTSGWCLLRWMVVRLGLARERTFVLGLWARASCAARSWRSRRRSAARPRLWSVSSPPPARARATRSRAVAMPRASATSRRCSASAASKRVVRSALAALTAEVRWPSDSRTAARFFRSAAIWSSMLFRISGLGWMSRTSTLVTTTPQAFVRALASLERMAFSCSRAEKVLSRFMRPISVRSWVNTRCDSPIS
mmetsp:Transcript_22350/g.72061  ORF Transcript_22350/g.72061 Transcript_22350/m.72061 type:complete len:204 (-) Transcript_22350:508-1119(-)